MKRTIAALFMLAVVLPADSRAATPQTPVIANARLTAAPARGLTVVLVKISNPSASPLTIYRVRSTFAPDAMLHYDVNMCQRGNQMNALPLVVIPAHRTLTLSTKGVGAMLTPTATRLVVGEQRSLTLLYSLNLHRATLKFDARVIPAPRGLITKPSSSTVG